MKLIYEYEAQYPDHDTEYWTIIRDNSEAEKEDDYLSPVNKTKASYCAAFYPGDLPVITFFPASRGRTLNDVNNDYKDQYFIIITNRENDTTLTSKISYSWDEASTMMKQYSKIIFPNLKKLLEKKFNIRLVK